MHIIVVDLGPAKHKVKFLSSGDSVFLPCVVNASNNVYPIPDHIKWWKDGSQLEHEVKSCISSLFNVITYYSCFFSY